MKYGLNIRESGEFDFLSLGALVHRLDPGIIPFRKAIQCLIHVSGGEFNVAANLADCFKMKTALASAMVDYPIGDLIAERVLAMGVKPIYKHFEHNGATGPNMATVYSDRGAGVRPPVVFYNRANEAGAMLKPGDFDWKKIFAGGVRWVHSGGIFAALSPTTAPLVAEMMQEAKAAGAITSFDLNFREKLWKISGGAEKAVETIASIVKNVDVLIGNEEDLQKGLGIPGPDVHAKSKLDPSIFFGMIDNVVKKHPHVKIVATTLREVERGGVDRRQDPCRAHRGVGRDRSRRRRRRLCGRLHLRIAQRRRARDGAQAGLGAWRVAHHVHRRHHHGDARPGARVCQGRIGENSAVKTGVWIQGRSTVRDCDARREGQIHAAMRDLAVRFAFRSTMPAHLTPDT